MTLYITDLDGTFTFCTSLKSITIPSSVTYLHRTFSYCEALESVTLPNTLTTIEANTFSACTSLTTITIPASVTSIGDFAFSGCTSLASISIPESVTSFGFFAFSDCKALTSFTIPASVTEIGVNPFNGCTALTSVTCQATTPPALESMTFLTKYDATLYVPAGSLGKYQDSNWADYFANISELNQSAIDDIRHDGQDITLRTEGSTLEILNLADNETVSIYTTAGACLYQGTGRLITLTPGSVYILRTPRAAIKFAL